MLTPNDIKTACPGADADFVVTAMDNGWTIEQCQRNAAHQVARQKSELETQLQHLSHKIESFDVDLAKLKKENARLTVANEDLTTKLEAAIDENQKLKLGPGDFKKGVGVEGMKVSPVRHSRSKAMASAHETFWSAVAEEQAKGKSRQEAIRIVNRRDPELRQAMLAEANG